MSKMSQELDKRLEENKYEMWEALNKIYATEPENNIAKIIAKVLTKIEKPYIDTLDLRDRKQLEDLVSMRQVKAKINTGHVKQKT